ncbi:hypothetical protein CLV63_111125 [Murinocardiopsis flavida]|uniref:Uncharacterized protein n=1 Tax=Murinocardiopsis flavida TaxID=645275 RepID=A0A2P8DH23_9ACTN|nr:hypothetical protein CLV63_111125 [Murinocardiopsis flavida]
MRGRAAARRARPRTEPVVDHAVPGSVPWGGTGVPYRAVVPRVVFILPRGTYRAGAPSSTLGGALCDPRPPPFHKGVR